MRSSICGIMLSAGLLVAASTSLRAQDQKESPGTASDADLGITYSTEHAQLAPGTCGCFWLQGGEADLGVTLWKGLGVAAALSGETVSNYAPGIDFTKLSYLGGPRYTYTQRRSSAAGPHLQIFGEGLFGGAHALSGAFPSGTATVSTANSFAMQTGGGLNLIFPRRLGVRLLQVEYVRTQLPNSYANTQNDLRLGFGAWYHIGSFRLPLHR